MAFLIVVFVVVLGVVAGIAYYLTTLTTPTTTTSTPPSHAQLKVTDVVSEGFVYRDGEIYWRFKIFGELDLRDKVEVNGVYDFWFGHINITLPNGERADIFKPPDYTNIVVQLRYLSGSEVFDAYVLDIHAWWKESFLEGTYRVVVWLQGPYDNRTVLFDKSFYFRMAPEISITSTVWNSWSESLRLTVANEGDVPLVLLSIGIEQAGTRRGIGWCTVEELIMPGESREVTAPIQFYDYVKEEFKGKEAVLDFLVEFAGARQLYRVTLNVKFPNE